MYTYVDFGKRSIFSRTLYQRLLRVHSTKKKLPCVRIMHTFDRTAFLKGQTYHFRLIHSSLLGPILCPWWEFFFSLLIKLQWNTNTEFQYEIKDMQNIKYANVRKMHVDIRLIARQNWEYSLKCDSVWYWCFKHFAISSVLHWVSILI